MARLFSGCTSSGSRTPSPVAIPNPAVCFTTVPGAAGSPVAAAATPRQIVIAPRGVVAAAPGHGLQPRI
jgi:hypothetical protein